MWRIYKAAEVFTREDLETLFAPLFELSSVVTCEQYADADRFLLGGVWLARRNRETKELPIYGVPEKLTPFSLVAFLRRISKDQRLSFAATDQASLQATITDLEARFFTERTDSVAEGAELQSVFENWKAKAQHSYAKTGAA